MSKLKTEEQYTFMDGPQMYRCINLLPECAAVEKYCPPLQQNKHCSVNKSCLMRFLRTSDLTKSPQGKIHSSTI